MAHIQIYSPELLTGFLFNTRILVTVIYKLVKNGGTNFGEWHVRDSNYPQLAVEYIIIRFS